VGKEGTRRGGDDRSGEGPGGLSEYVPQGERGESYEGTKKIVSRKRGVHRAMSTLKNPPSSDYKKDRKVFEKKERVS